LQSALYNVVNNAIKYSYDNTIVSVDYFEDQEPESYIFKIKNYGWYLNPKELRIYNKNFRMPAPERPGGIVDDYVVEGEGLGLYWSKMVIRKLGGEIWHDCKRVSKYHVPFMELFFERCVHFTLFRKMWDNLKESYEIPDELLVPSYDEMMNEHIILQSIGSEGKDVYKKVNMWNIDIEKKKMKEKIKIIKKKISNLRIYTDISMPTYEVTFTIRIPKLEKES
jgi:hypothetical protein